MSSKNVVKSYTKKRKARKTAKVAPYKVEHTSPQVEHTSPQVEHTPPQVNHIFRFQLTNERGDIIRTLTHRHFHAFDLNADPELTNTWSQSSTSCSNVCECENGMHQKTDTS